MTLTTINIISITLVLIGTFGAVLPFLPGLPVAWVGLLVYSWYYQFPVTLIWGLVIFGIFIALSIVVDIFAPAIAASGIHASRKAMAGAVLGGFVGLFTLGPLGIIVGPFVGAYIGEILSSQNPTVAFRVAVSSLFGIIIGSVFKLLVGISMLIFLLTQII